MKTDTYLKGRKQDYLSITVTPGKVKQSWEDIVPLLEDQVTFRHPFLRVAIPFMILIALLIGGGLTYVRASVAKPGDSLYPLRQFSDTVRVAISGNPEKSTLPEIKDEVEGLEVPPKPVKKSDVIQETVRVETEKEATKAGEKAEKKEESKDDERTRGVWEERDEKKEEDKDDDETKDDDRLRSIFERNKQLILERYKRVKPRNESR
ncbi:MAG: hypothetical protein ACOX6V_02110 [Patescibacteria group bacterium]|jgi:hypothetical protein